MQKETEETAKKDSMRSRRKGQELKDIKRISKGATKSNLDQSK